MASRAFSPAWTPASISSTQGLEKGNQDRLHEGLDTAKLTGERIRNVVMNILYNAKGRELNFL